MLLRRRAGLLAIALAVLGLLVFVSIARGNHEQAKAPILARLPEESDGRPPTDIQVPISEPEEIETDLDEESDDDAQSSGENDEEEEEEIVDFDADDDQAGGSPIQHREIYSVSTRDRKYLKILFFGEDAYGSPDTAAWPVSLTLQQIQRECYSAPDDA